MEKHNDIVMKFKKPVLGFAAYSGTGKTTLLVKLLPILKSRGLRIAMIKHAHHDFDIDKPGKDSYELRKAGADQMLIASDKRWVLMTETPEGAGPQLEALIEKINLDECDLVLVEGFRHVPFEKIELHRSSLQKDIIYPEDKSVIAVASDEKLTAGDLPWLNLNEPAQVADFICIWLKRSCRS